MRYVLYDPKKMRFDTLKGTSSDISQAHTFTLKEARKELPLAKAWDNIEYQIHELNVALGIRRK